MKKETAQYDLLQPENFGDWLADERVKRGLSRKQLAELSGVSKQSIYGYEMFGHSPSLYNLTCMLSAMGLMIVIKRNDDGKEES